MLVNLEIGERRDSIALCFENQPTVVERLRELRIEAYGLGIVCDGLIEFAFDFVSDPAIVERAR